MSLFVVGARYPLPFTKNMRFHLDAADSSLEMRCEFVLERPSQSEQEILLSGPIKLAVVRSQPIAWITLQAEGLSYDAPYAISVEDTADATAIKDALKSWSSSGPRQVIRLFCIDGSDGKIFGIRFFSVSGEWMARFADAVAACGGDASKADVDDAILRDHRRWPTVAAMASAASSVEFVGHV